MTRPTQITTAVAVMILVGAALAIVIRLAERERLEPARCPPGLVAIDARCCGQGQRLLNGHCAGAPSACGAGMIVVLTPRPGCAAQEARIAEPGGNLHLGPSDWDGQTALAMRDL